MDLNDSHLKAHLKGKLYPPFLVWVLKKRLDADDIIRNICEFAFDLRGLKSPTAKIMTDLTRTDIIQYWDRVGDVRLTTMWEMPGVGVCCIYSQWLLNFETPADELALERDAGFTSQRRLDLNTNAFTVLTSTYARVTQDYWLF